MRELLKQELAGVNAWGAQTADDRDRKVASLLYAGLEYAPVVAYDGRTGMPLTKLVESGNGPTSILMCKPTELLWGFTAFQSLCQKASDKFHMTHTSVNATIKGMNPGKSGGGGIRISDMDVSAATSAGLYGTLQELWDRKDAVVVEVCTGCWSIVPSCICGLDSHVASASIPTVRVRLPYSTVKFACIAHALGKRISFKIGGCV